jgi:hypothetical protein
LLNKLELDCSILSGDPPRPRLPFYCSKHTGTVQTAKSKKPPGANPAAFRCSENAD